MGYVVIIKCIQPFEIGDEIIKEISISQDGGGMIGDKKAILRDLAAQGCNALPTYECQCRPSVSQQADNFRLDNFYLSLQIGATLIDFCFLRLSVLGGTAFDDAGYEYLLSLYACLL